MIQPDESFQKPSSRNLMVLKMTVIIISFSLFSSLFVFCVTTHFLPLFFLHFSVRKILLLNWDDWAPYGDVWISMNLIFSYSFLFYFLHHLLNKIILGLCCKLRKNQIIKFNMSHCDKSFNWFSIIRIWSLFYILQINYIYVREYKKISIPGWNDSIQDVEIFGVSLEKRNLEMSTFNFVTI